MSNKIMQNNKINRNLVITFICTWLVFVIVLSIISFINWSYLTGFIIGSIFSILTYWINDILYGIFLSKRKSYKLMFLITFIKFFIWMSIFSGITILILFVNKWFNNRSIYFMDWCDGVFNIFLFIVGSSMSFITIIVYHIAEPIMNRKTKKRMKGE